ncbi:BamA/TamA family outer membrane protein [Aureisphaera galaxeae]|uniref:POTRA domain-containing protein n=1 Tax=Aureisphaera galaxeae TaxID=1538023 RepID=UPI0023505E89|nr:POTRA domain-containing protein [Aureisphaera galaxeae]MDC8005585.1 BamA/TamA family outer membrane protein [Aureisphaera galaxeae]
MSNNYLKLKYEKRTNSVSFTDPKGGILKRVLYLILYLNIYIQISEVAHAQNLTLEIKAEKAFTEGLLDSLETKTNHPDYKSLSSELDSLLPKLQKRGFLESRLIALERKNDSLFGADLYLGNRWSRIKIHYNPEQLDSDLLKIISNEVEENHFTILIANAETVLSYLNKQLSQDGNPFARVALSNIQKKDQKTLEAQLNIQLGPQRTLDKIVIKGYEKFPQSFLKYYAGIRTGKTLDRDKVTRQNELLNNLGFVSTIKPPEALFRKDSTTIYFYLEKRNNNLFDGILGFATNPETQKIEFNGFLNLELNNNLNFGEQLLLNYKADGREQQNFKAKAVLPYLFKSPFGVSGELTIFKRDSTFSTTDQQARLHYQAGPNLSLSAGYRTYESSNLLDEVIAGSAVEDYNSRYALLGVAYRRPQIQGFFPVKTRIELNGEIGNRENDAGKQDQFRITGRLSHIFSLNLRNSIYLNSESSVLSSDDYLTNELFRFGGINSIRGFSENSIDASLFTVLNTEYRYLFNATTYVHSIVDVAYFENNVLDLKEELFSFGLGLGLNTEAGVFRFNIANGISQDQEFKFSNTKIHISLSSRF